MSKKQEDGIHALNKEFEKFEGVTKDQAYQLVENEEDDEFDDEFVIQTCDMRDFFEGGDEGMQEPANFGT